MIKLLSYTKKTLGLLAILMTYKTLYAAIKITNLSLKEPLLIKTVASAYDDVPLENQALFHARYVFDGRSSAIRCPKKKNCKNFSTKTYTLKTKKTKELFDMGFILISPASPARTGEVALALKNLLQTIGNRAWELAENGKKFAELTTVGEAVSGTLASIEGIMGTDIPTIKNAIDEINAISVRSNYAANDHFVIIDRKIKPDDLSKPEEQQELAKPEMQIKFKGKTFTLNSYNKFIAVYVDRDVGAKLPRKSECPETSKKYVFKKEGKSFSFKKLINKGQQKRTLGFTKRELFWCEGKKERGFYNVGLFESIETRVHRGRFYIIISLKEDTHNQEHTHRGRSQLILSLSCKKKRCKKANPEIKKDAQDFIRRVTAVIKRERGKKVMTEEFFRDKKETKDLEDLDTTKQRRKTLPRKEKKKGEKNKPRRNSI